MNFAGLSVGVWGTGIVGTSALYFFIHHNARVALYDKKPLSPATQMLCDLYQIRLYKPDELEDFLRDCAYILPSAGIDLKPYSHLRHKFLNEVDLFFERYTKPVIAITGTLGKTTLTQSLHAMLTFYGHRAQLGGNIGVGLFDLLPQQGASDYAVIELSSFQLEHAKQAAPYIAVWTNLFPNHLDRHNTLEEYFLAKFQLLKNQTAQHHALVHESVRNYLAPYELTSSVTYFDSVIEKDLQERIMQHKIHGDHYIILYKVAQLLNLDLERLQDFFNTLEAPEHRVQYIGSFQGVDFYDDSKSTVIQATQAALKRCSHKPVILYFGGVSKGVSRKDFFYTIPAHVKHICFFGKEAAELNRLCKKTTTPSSEHATLHEAFIHSLSLMNTGDIALLSPGGASFDLFTDYTQRGRAFQELFKKMLAHDA